MTRTKELHLLTTAELRMKEDYWRAVLDDMSAGNPMREDAVGTLARIVAELEWRRPTRRRR